MKKVFAFVMAALMIAAMFAGCAPAGGNTDLSGNKDDAGNTSATIKIGTSGPLTGPNAQYGLAVEAAMKIAVEEINAKGGLQFEFKAEDDEADGEKAVSAYNQLKTWGMDIFAGSVTSGSAAAAAAEAVQDNLFVLTPSASAVEVANTGANVFQMCFTDPNQGASAAELMAKKWPSATIGMIYDSSDAYSTGIANGFLAKAEELKLNVAVKDAAFTSDTKADLSTQVTMCKDANCDMVFLPFYYTEASQVLTYADTIGYKPTFFGCDGMDGILSVEGFDKKLAEGLVLMTPFDANATDDATVSFVKKYKEQNNGETPNQFGADGYDVVYAIYNALTAAGLDGTASSSEICDALVKQFTTMTFDGLTGKGMTWGKDGMISKTPAAVVITDGVYVPMS